MNILMISGDRALASGKQGAFFNTLSELHKHFDRIDIICPRVPMRRYDMVVLANVYVHPSPLPLLLQPLWVLWKGVRLFHAHRYSAYTCHNPFSNSIGAMLLHWATGVPYMVEIFHIEGYPRVASVRQFITRLWTALLARWLTRPAAAVRVMNTTEVPRFLTRHGVPSEKIRVIPAIYVDLKAFSPQNIPKQYDLIFVGRLVANKGLNLFMQVIARTKRPALVVGEGPLLATAKRRAHREHLPVNFHGFARDSAEVAQLINRSRLLVMTSYNEGGPRVVVEALACGVPVVATPVGIVPEVLPPEAIEGWDAMALADKVNNILTDAELYERLRRSGLQAAPAFERSAAITAYADAIVSLAHE